MTPQEMQPRQQKVSERLTAVPRQRVADSCRPRVSATERQRQPVDDSTDGRSGRRGRRFESGHPNQRQGPGESNSHLALFVALVIFPIGAGGRVVVAHILSLDSQRPRPAVPKGPGPRTPPRRPLGARRVLGGWGWGRQRGGRLLRQGRTVMIRSVDLCASTTRPSGFAAISQMSVGARPGTLLKLGGSSIRGIRRALRHR